MPTVVKTEITIQQQIGASPAAVYRAFTNQVGIREWLSNGANTNAREGGYFFVWWNEGHHVRGQYTKLEENKAVNLTWQGYEDPTQTEVEVTLEEKDGGTFVTLRHTGSGEYWEKYTSEVEAEWHNVFENLVSVLETGIDLRVSRLPMLGIAPGGQVNEETAADYGLDADDAFGMIVNSAFPDTGAEAAGLQSRDVILKLNNIEIRDFAAYSQMMKQRRAGDVIPVEYFRDGETHMVDMALSTRPMPSVPDTAAELAKIVKDAYAQLDQELTEILEGVSEAEASAQPAEGEWCVKEVLCHLIHSERAALFSYAVLVSNREVLSFSNNLPAFIKATLDAYGTLEALRAEFYHSQQEVLIFIENLPDEFVANKATYVRSGQSIQQFVFHPRSHYQQIKEAIEAAR